MKRTILYILTLWVVTNLYAQEVSHADSLPAATNETLLTFNGYGRASVFGGGSTYDLATTFAELSLQTVINKGAAILKSDLRFRTGQFFNQEAQAIEIKELYVGYSGKSVEVLLGNQLVNWGRTDGFNPTNNITPNDYFFLSADPNDQKKSNFLLKLNYRPLPGVRLEAIGIPFYKMSDYRFELFDMGNNVSIANDVLPDKTLANASVAVRADIDFPAAGGSVSLFHGYDPFHGYNVESVDWSSGQPAIEIASTPYKKTTLGADIAVPVGNWIFRGETAYNLTNHSKDQMYVPNSDLCYVAGVETSIAGVTLIGQYIGKYTLDYKALTAPVLSDPTNSLAIVEYANASIEYENRLFNRKLFNQQEKTNHAASLTVSKSFAYDVLNTECTVYHNFTSNEWLIRPKLTWKITDALSTSLGGNYMHGNATSLFGHSSAVLNGAFVELKITF